MENPRVYWLRALPTSEAETGGAASVALPIERDKATGWPVVAGSAVQSARAEHFRVTEESGRSGRKSGVAFRLITGEETNAADAGASIHTDARLVCLPVRSRHGAFAWCTCPLVLQTIHRELSLAGMDDLPVAPQHLEEGLVHRTTTTKIVDKDSGRVFLEELDFAGKECPTATKWAKRFAEWVFPGDENKTARDFFAEKFAVVPNSTFHSFTREWTGELPAETILAGLAGCDRVSSPVAK